MEERVSSLTTAGKEELLADLLGLFFLSPHRVSHCLWVTISKLVLLSWFFTKFLCRVCLKNVKKFSVHMDYFISLQALDSMPNLERE